MNLNKKVVESMTVASTVLVMTTITALGGSTKDGLEDVTANIVTGKEGAAGIALDFEKMNREILGISNFMMASIEKAPRMTVSKGADTNKQEAKQDTEIQLPAENQEVTASDKEDIAEASGAAGLGELVAVTTDQSMDIAMAGLKSKETLVETKEISEVKDEEITDEAEVKAAPEQEEAQEKEEEQQPEQSPEEAEWENRVMADVEEDMNIRTAPDANSELAGKFYRGDVAEVISIEGEWTQISSGNATGYVKNEYLVYGMDANHFANEVCSLYATVNAEGLRLRSEPSEEAGVVTMAKNGEKLKVDKEAEPADGWVAVHTSDSTAYVSAEYVEVALNLGTALNSEEVAAKEAEEAKAAEEAKKPAVSANADEVTLLGALIQCEAGNGSYEGMLAIGSVVMNRVRSGGYPGSLSGVIYQAGQFPPALNGSVARVAASGVRSACLQAAREALGGADNTNGALSFRSAASGCQGTVIGGNVFF